MSAPTGHDATPTCYRHSDVASGVSCQRCERPICTACMHQASVGVHCPECVSKNKQRVYTRQTLPGSAGVVTNALIAMNLAAFVAQITVFNGTLFDDGDSAIEAALWGPSIDSGEWWRVFSSGFLHFGILHLGMNMFSLYRIGPVLERSLGPTRYALAYFVSLVGGSFGALLLSPLALTMGASGAIFGLLGLLVVMFRSRGIGLQQSGLADVLMINALISFSGYVSLGGHAGGFVVGLLLGALYWGVNPGDQPVFGRNEVKPNAATAVFGLALFLGCLWAAGMWSNPLFGF